ncbi:hypothetical protein D3C72_1380330 [compost metagenome]
MAGDEGASGDHVVAVARAVGVVLELEAAPGRDVGPGRERPVAVAARVEFVAAQLGARLGVVAGEVAAGELEHLELGELVLVGAVDVGAQLLLDGLEVAVARRMLAGVELPRADPARDLVEARLGRVDGHVAQRVGRGQLVVRQVAGVRQVHGAGRVVRVEPVVDALVLQQARQELVVALLVLHAVAARVVRADDVGGLGLLEALDRAVLEHRVEHLEHLLFLVDARVGALGEQPEPRAQRDAVLVVPPDVARAHEAHRMALAMPLVRAAVGVLELDDDVEGVAQDVLGGEVLVLGQHGELVGRGARQRLVPDDAPEHQVVLGGRIALDAELVVGHLGSLGSGASRCGVVSRTRR